MRGTGGTSAPVPRRTEEDTVWIGVDVMRTDELRALLGRDWFRVYVYTPQELAVADTFGPERSREFLTGRFAAKEAVLKVLGTGVGAGVTFRQIAVLRSASGAPLVRLTGAAARHAALRGIADVEVSVTHKQGTIVAAAIGVPTACRAAHPADRTAERISATTLQALDPAR